MKVGGGGENASNFVSTMYNLHVWRSGCKAAGLPWTDMDWVTHSNSSECAVCKRKSLQLNVLEPDNSG